MITIDYRSKEPIYGQIMGNIKRMIFKKGLVADEQLPSIRELAGELAINPNTISRAYKELEQEGYIYTLVGKGNFVSPTANADEHYITDLKQEFTNIVLELIYLGETKENIVKIINNVA